MQDKIPAYIFDIDGVLADNSHRQGLLNQPGKTKTQSWNEFCAASIDDPLFQSEAQLLKTLQAAGYKILLVTGRSEDWESTTTAWLFDKGIEPDHLYQRRHLDFRKDFEVKSEIYQTQIEPYYSILGVFEDRADCVKMWRAFGLTCFQPREASY